MQRYRGYLRSVTGNFRKLAINVIADPDREIGMNDQERGCDDDEQRKPPAFRERLHSPSTPLNAACNCIKRTHFARAADVFTCPASGSRSEMQTSQRVTQLSNQKARPTLSVWA